MRFSVGQRVIVHTASNTHSGEPIATIMVPGTVQRTRRKDDGAWIRLDARHEDARVHPFPADDEHDRGRDVFAFPEDCEATR